MKKPEIPEIAQYLTDEKNYDEFTAAGFATQFWHFYESKGWMVGRNAMKSWKSAIVTWELKNKQNAKNNGNNAAGNKPAGTSAARIAALKGF